MATWQLPADLRDDPWIAEQIQKAVAPWQRVLRPEEIAWMKEQMLETLANDDHASKVLRRAHPKVGDRSGKVATGEKNGKEQPSRRRTKR